MHILQAGDTVPDTPLIDQDGQPMTLKDFRGSALAVSFIYTRCPLPQFCPLIDRRYGEVQKLAANDAALAGRIKLLSISFDPAFDRAEVLRAHAVKVGADPKVWRFATADESTVDRLAAEFGINVIREKDGTITHNLRTAVIDPAGPRRIDRRQQRLDRGGTRGVPQECRRHRYAFRLQQSAHRCRRGCRSPRRSGR